jgi:cystathionine beta-lyase/cystathionine gamma-synthase
VRGAHTLALRVDAACRNAARLASWLAERPAVETVIYPGLPSHPDHETARRVLGERFGAVLSLELAGGRAAADRLVERLRLIRLLSSLGGVATTLNHPSSTSHVDVSPERRREEGIHDGLLRLAVGIEALDDLIADLEPAL